MSRQTVLSNAQIVLDDQIVHGSVHIRDGQIADISAGPTTGAVDDDLEGDLLIPGLVELHTDHLEAHVRPRPSTRWDPAPAVLAHDVALSGAGVTTVFDSVRIGAQEGRDDETRSARSLAAAIEQVQQAGLTRVEHFIHLRCEVSSPSVVAEFEAFDDVSSLRLASLMDHTPGQRQYADVDAYRRYMLGKVRVEPDAIESYIAQLKVTAEEHSVPNRKAIAGLAAARGITLAAHDDATVEHVEESASFGVRISEFPTTEVAAGAAHDHDQLVVMGAPNIVRGGSQTGNVAAAALLEHGLLDILSSDYVPSSPLQAIVQLDADDRCPLVEGIALVSGNPARAVGLDDRGVVAVGKRADLVRVHTHALPATPRHPRGHVIPVVRSVYREGVRVS